MRCVLRTPDRLIQPRQSSSTTRRVGGVVEPEAAVLRRDRRAEQPELLHALDQSVRVLVGVLVACWRPGSPRARRSGGRCRPAARSARLARMVREWRTCLEDPPCLRQGFNRSRGQRTQRQEPRAGGPHGGGHGERAGGDDPRGDAQPAPRGWRAILQRLVEEGARSASGSGGAGSGCAGFSSATTGATTGDVGTWGDATGAGASRTAAGDGSSGAESAA